jgi:hypothetical protein
MIRALNSMVRAWAEASGLIITSQVLRDGSSSVISLCGVPAVTKPSTLLQQLAELEYGLYSHNGTRAVMTWCSRFHPATNRHRECTHLNDSGMASKTLSDKPNSDRFSEQHKRFRYLLALNRFLRTINNDTGYPSLNETSINERIDPLSSRERFIDTLMTILVLDHEVIAAIPLHGHPEKAIIYSGDSLPEGDKTNSRQPFDDELEIVFEDEGKTEQSPSDGMSTCIRDPYQPAEDDDGGYDLTDTSWFATVPNPHTGDGSGEDGVIYLVEEGQDFWPRCQTGDFDELIRDLKWVFSLLSTYSHLMAGVSNCE